jgi:hypothetical protein
MQRNLLLGLLILFIAGGVALWLKGESRAADGINQLDLQRGSVAPLQPSAGIQEGAGPDPWARAEDRDPTTVTRSSGLLGRCIDHHDLEGIPGTRVTFLSSGARVGSSESDDGGDFQLRLSGPSFDEVQIDPPKGWWCVKHGIKGEEYQVRLARDDVSPLRAKLVDRVSGDPLPFYTVKLQGPEGWDEILSSDEKGLLESETLFAAGEIILSATEEEFGAFRPRTALAVHAHKPSGAAPPVVSIPVTGGATYYIALENPAKIPLHMLGASLSHPWNLEDGESFGGNVRGARIHPGKYPWTRTHWSLPNSQKPHLVVEDFAGRWRGYAPVDSSPGVHQTPVSIRLEPRIRLSGHVFNAQGEPVQGAQVQLLNAEDGEYVNGVATSVLGLYVLEGIKPGAYRLTALGVMDGRAEMEFPVAGAEPLVQDLHLEPYLVGGDVEGRVRSLSGAYKNQTVVSLKPVDTASKLPTRWATVVWEEVGPVVEGHYKFADVAAGEYGIRLARVWVFDVQQDAVTVRAGAGGVDFVVCDDVRRYPKRFKAVDKTTGEPLPDAMLRLAAAAGEMLYEGTLAGYTEPIFLAQGEDFTWLIRHDGYESQSGTRATYEGMDRGGQYEKRVPLDPLPKSDRVS